MDALYVDLDGTLVEYTARFEAIYDTAVAGLDGTPADVEAYSEAFFDVLGDAETRGSAARSSEGRGASNPFAAAVAATDATVDPAAFSAAMVEAEREHVAPVDGARATLDALAGEYRLGVLTNGFGPAQRGKLEAAGLADAFETVVVSGEVGVRKPDPGIYEIAEERLPADSYAFVADDLDRDVRPAVERGWRGVYVGADAESVTATDVDAVRTLDGVREVM